jgi:predicted acyl esterase
MKSFREAQRVPTRVGGGICSWITCRSLALLGMTGGLHAQLVVDSNVAVPMRDGVVLRADVWRPSAEGRYPTLVYRTPYGKHQATAAFSTGRKAVARGYIVVFQDVRGRYASDGEFLPYQQEGRDGFDTIEWAARQPWASGWVGTFGLSYPGAVQWLAAIENPPSLQAMVPAMTFASPMQFWYSNGVWDNSWITWINANIRADRSRRIGGDTAFRRIAPWHEEWRRHPAYDPWWSWADLSDKYGRVSAAVLNLSAWYDDAYGPHGAINNYKGLVRSRGGSTRTRLVMGPWTHGVPRANRTAAGEREYGATGAIDYDALVLDWMDEHRGVGGTSVSREPVRVFVLGSNRWLDASAWPIPGALPDTMVLRRAGTSTTIVSDPDHPVVDTYADRAGGHDYRAIADRSDVVIFESQPLARDKTVVGAMRAEIFVSSDAPDTDIWVKIYDVAPDGTAFNLMSSGLDVLRASYRKAQPDRELLQPGRVYQLDLADLLTANTFRKGHRIRVAIMTSFAPNFSRNLHTGQLETEAMKGRTARVTVHHDARYPSRVILPTLPASP